MNASGSGVQIRAWTAVGAMTPEAIFARLDESIADCSGAFPAEEHAALKRNFETICDRNGHITEPAFTTFVLSKTDLSPALTKAVHILFDSLCYLGQVPLQTISPPQAYLTLQGLTRALMWSLPERAPSIIADCPGHRSRTPADHRRLIFQSLATSRGGANIPYDLKSARALAAENAAVFSQGSELRVDDADLNFDEHGDEMYHDVIDVMASTLPYIPPTFAPPSRDGYHALANMYHAGSPSLYDLTIPNLRLEAFLTLLLTTNFVDGVLDVSQDLESVARSMVASFRQHRRLESEALRRASGRPSGPIDGSTWPIFNFAISKLLVSRRPLVPLPPYSLRIVANDS